MKWRIIFAAPLAVSGAALGTPWAAWQELKIRNTGQHLEPEMIDWAQKIGIVQPEEIRVCFTSQIPFLLPTWVLQKLSQRGFPGANPAGLCLRRGIFLSNKVQNSDLILRHELVHTRQYQESGSFFFFLTKYFFQCISRGYYDAPMEQEAREQSLSPNNPNVFLR